MILRSLLYSLAPVPLGELVRDFEAARVHQSRRALVHGERNARTFLEISPVAFRTVFFLLLLLLLLRHIPRQQSAPRLFGTLDAAPTSRRSRADKPRGDARRQPHAHLRHFQRSDLVHGVLQVRLHLFARTVERFVAHEVPVVLDSQQRSGLVEHVEVSLQAALLLPHVLECRGELAPDVLHLCIQHLDLVRDAFHSVHGLFDVPPILVDDSPQLVVLFGAGAAG